MKYLIYKTTNLINGKIYIGKHQTLNENDDYLGSGKHLKNSIQKYGKENFKKETLYIFDNETQMNQKEAELVTEDFCKEDTNYNICPGGQGGWGYVNSNNSILKARARTHANNRDYKDKNYISKLSKSTSISNKRRAEAGYKPSNNFVYSFLGKSHTEETKKLISNKLKGKVSSTKGRIWIHNLHLKKAKMIFKEELADYKKLGWIVGNRRKF